MTTKMQSCVDHIKTSCDVDPWAAEMVEKIFLEYDRLFDKVLEIIDDEIASWERIRDELGCRPSGDNAEAALAMARSRIEEALKEGEHG